MLVAQADWLKGHGVPLAAMTLGNEPFHSTPTYPSMLLSDAQMVALAAQASPALGQRDVELWAVDHNWELRDHYDAVLAGAPGAFAASAFHCYGGYPGQMGAVAAPPVVTECTGTNDGFDGTFRWDAKNLVVDAIDAGSTGLMMWNLALNENHGPHTGGCDTCRGVIDVNSQTVAVTRNPEFYTLAHLARAADPGAVVVGNSWTSGVPYVAFRNPDGSIGIFGHNDTGSTQVFGVALDGWASASRFEVGADELFTLRGQSGMVAGSVGLSDESPVVGRSLASTLAGWSPDPLHVDYQWLSDGSPIVGATGPTFTPRPSEVGAALSLQARGSRPGFTGATAVSVASVRVRPASLPAVLNVVRPRVSGTAQVGRTMTVTRGTWLPSSAAIAPQWFRDSSPIAGARGFSYAIRPADLGRRIWARAVATAPGRTRLDVVTPRSPRVRPGTFVVLARGRVRGAAHVGSRVWWEGTRSRPAASISFQWAADGAVIASAASRRPSYVLRQADRGHIMSVRLTLRAAGYLSMSVVVRQPGRVA
jgi:hypothetical protein